MAHRKLSREVQSTTIHGTTGQELDEGTLGIGTLVRKIETEQQLLAGEEVTATYFEASTDGGHNWYRQRTYGDVVTD